MYSSKLKVTLQLVDGRRFLQVEDNTNTTGECYQIGTAEGSDANNPSASNSLAKFNCNAKFNRDISNNDKVILTNALLVVLNEEKWEEQLYDDNIIVSDAIGNQIELEAQRKGLTYSFNHNGEICNYNEKGTCVILNGTVVGEREINNKQYQMNINENNSTCELKKAANSTDATLSCVVHNKNITGFYIDDQNKTIDNDSTIYLTMKKGLSLCSIENIEDNEYNGQYKKISSSSKGISGGVIAAIVIFSVVVIVLIIGVIVSKTILNKSSAIQTISVSDSCIAKLSNQSNHKNPTNKI